MKKIFCALLVFTAAFLYAEVTITGMIDMSIVPFQFIYDPDPYRNAVPNRDVPEPLEMVMGAGAGRISSGQGPRARLDVRASHEDVIGMRMRIQARTDGIGIEDYLQVWWRPQPWMRVDAGRFFDDRLRGKINDLDERMNAYTVRMYDADAIFTRFRTHWSGQAGLMLSFTPPAQENLWFGVLMYDLNPFDTAGAAGSMYDAHPDYVTDNADVFKRIQVAAAYTIDGIGLARVQYFGAKPGVEIIRITDEWLDDSNTPFHSYLFDTFSITAPRIEAAFAFTGFPNLTLDIGGKWPLPFKNWDRGPLNIFEKNDETLLDPIYLSYKRGFVWQAPYQLSLGLKYKLDSLELAGRADAHFLGSMKGHSIDVFFAPMLNIHVWPSYEFSFGRLIFNFGYEWIGAAYDRNGELIGKDSPVALNGGHRMGTGLSIHRNITGNSFVKGGIACKLPGVVNGVQEKMVFSIPLCLEFVF
ncbi:MAG: hypothetical protein LBC80_02060 [Treponema sp.]|jgi:hypothetical protein|nr:hypothetical protein [Treponema sp.]